MRSRLLALFPLVTACAFEGPTDADAASADAASFSSGPWLPSAGARPLAPTWVPERRTAESTAGEPAAADQAILSGWVSDLGRFADDGWRATRRTATAFTAAVPTPALEWVAGTVRDEWRRQRSLVAFCDQLVEPDAVDAYCSGGTVDLTPLLRLPRLETLYLSVDAVADPSVFAQLPNVHTLSVGEAYDTEKTSELTLADIAQLRGLRRLNYTNWAGGTAFDAPDGVAHAAATGPIVPADVSVLANLPLESLAITVPGLTGLDALTGLRTLILTTDEPPHLLEALAHMPELRELTVVSPSARTLDGLAGAAPQLQRLTVIDAQSDLTPVRGLGQLAELEWWGAESVDLRDLAGKPLTELRLQVGRVSHPAVLAELPLRTLAAPATVLPALRGHAQLEHLELFYGADPVEPRDLRPLLTLRRLKSLVHLAHESLGECEVYLEDQGLRPQPGLSPACRVMRVLSLERNVEVTLEVHGC